MDRITKKCLIASAGLHGLLVLVIAFGAAFQPKPKPQITHRINVIPSKFVEAMLAGGGGNPNLPRTDDMVKGNTLQPVEPPAPPPPPTPKPPTPKPPTPQPPTPQPEPVRPVEPVKPAVKPTPTPTPTRPVTKVPDNLKLTPVKPVDKPADKPVEKLALVPTVRTDAAKEKARRDAEAREAVRQAAQAEAKYRSELAQQFGKAAQSARAGFESGKVVEVGGPDGEAYANYALLVEAAYRAAIQSVSDFSDRDFTVRVEITIARSGRVMLSRVVRRSGNPVMDRAVQRAMDRVQAQGLPPFPEGAKDSDRKFTIEYSFRARRAAG